MRIIYVYGMLLPGRNGRQEGLETAFEVLTAAGRSHGLLASGMVARIGRAWPRRHERQTNFDERLRFAPLHGEFRSVGSSPRPGRRTPPRRRLDGSHHLPRLGVPEADIDQTPARRRVPADGRSDRDAAGVPPQRRRRRSRGSRCPRAASSCNGPRDSAPSSTWRAAAPRCSGTRTAGWRPGPGRSSWWIRSSCPSACEGYPLDIPGPEIARTITVRPEATTLTYSHPAFTVRHVLVRADRRAGAGDAARRREHAADDGHRLVPPAVAPDVAGRPADRRRLLGREGAGLHDRRGDAALRRRSSARRARATCP